MENKQLCPSCNKPVDHWSGADVYHLDCAMAETETIRAHVHRRGLDAAKEHVNQEVPHA